LIIAKSADPMPPKKVKKSKNKSSPAATRRKRASPPDRRASRIPGVDVGHVVDTSLGPKKKVYFNMGGRWYFRMVDPCFQKAYVIVMFGIRSWANKC